MDGNVNDTLTGLDIVSVKTPLRWIFCSYEGRLTVYDYNEKIHELSGMLTYDKYLEIEERSDSNTEFKGGYDDYKRIASQLKYEYGTTFVMSVFNHSNNKQDLSLFYANANMTALNYGNVSDLEITTPGKNYLNFIINTVSNPFKISRVRFESKYGHLITINKENSNGATLSQPLDSTNHMSPTQLNPNIVDVDQPVIIDASTSICIPVSPKQGLDVKLIEDTLILKFDK